MPSVFLSYRRQDSAAIVGRIADRLKQRLGQQAVFMDIDAIPLGVDFRRHIDEALSACEALLVVIGDHWLATDDEGRRRIDDPTDFVRLEIETAIARKVPIIPTLVGEAVMPTTEALPPSISSLVYYNAIRIDHGKDFVPHTDQLLKAIHRMWWYRDPEGMTLTHRITSAVCGFLGGFGMIVGMCAVMGVTFWLMSWCVCWVANWLYNWQLPPIHEFLVVGIIIGVVPGGIMGTISAIAGYKKGLQGAFRQMQQGFE